MLDPKLTFSTHVEYIKRKAISRLKMLGKTRAIVGADTSLQLYKSLITPLFDYAAPAYDCLSQKDSYTLQTVQNCALRIILKQDRRSHIVDMHRELKLHYLADRRHMLTLGQVYKGIHGIAPQNISNQLRPSRDGGTRVTRSNEGYNLEVPRSRLETSRRSFKYRGPWYWNLLDSHIQSSESFEIFKHRLYTSDTFAPV